MKKYTGIWMGLMSLLVSTPAFAVDSSKTYSSGLPVALLASTIPALIVVVQLMPTLMLLYGFVKGLLRGHGKVQHQVSRR